MSLSGSKLDTLGDKISVKAEADALEVEKAKKAKVEKKK